MERMRLASISTVWRLMTRMPAPKCSRIFRDSVTSEIWGIFSIRQTPSTSRAAGMMATAAFLAPLISTSPNRDDHPVQYTLSKSIPSSKGVFCGGTCNFYETVCPARAASYPLKTCETGEIFRMGKLTHPNYTISPRKMQTLPASRTGSASKFVKIPKPPTAENSRFRPNRGAQAEKFGNKLSARQGPVTQPEETAPV